MLSQGFSCAAYVRQQGRSERAGKRIAEAAACIFASSYATRGLYLGLIQSCKACDVNPWSYFDDILRRLMSHPVRRLRELLPDQWRPAKRDARGLILQS